ncbi:hypothetical protein PR048_031673 [Dryococelus australis]|uniref:Uncharacterized protein n=1 Tax=Dryococelus australis TaxID=614101 RepID=A0ABQ9G8V9_9NEOP|nr:hypothetical protein PR048_031673 [Dryococelus australis]
MRVKQGKYGAAMDCRGRGNRRSQSKTHRLVVSSSKIPTCRNPVYSPPIKANQVQYPVGSRLDFRKWESCRTMLSVDCFLGDLSFSPSLHSGDAPFSHRLPLICTLDLVPPITLGKEALPIPVLLKTVVTQINDYDTVAAGHCCATRSLQLRVV